MSEPTWELLGGGGVIGGPVDYVGDWAAGTAYLPGQVVRYAGVDYLAVNPSTGQVPPLASPLAPGMVCLADQILSADAASIDFTNISQAYSHLQLIFSCRSTRAAQATDVLCIRFNGDSSAIHSGVFSGQGVGAGDAAAWGSQNRGYMGRMPAANANAAGFASGEATIPDYRSVTKKKQLHGLIGIQTTVAINNNYVSMFENVWDSLAAIYSISLFADIGPLLVAGSRASLYGLLAAGQAPPVTTLAPGGIGTSFPASPTNGELFTLVDSLTAPTYAWDFRYVASITDAYKWVFVGGSPAVIENSTGETVTADFVYRDTPTIGPLFTIPRSGSWVLGTSLYFSAPAACMAAAAVKLGAAAARDDESVFLDLYAGTAVAAAMNSFKRTLVLGDVLKMQYRSNSAGTFYHRRLFVTPVRLS